ncbi:MAG TPA: hypothetical protein VF598_06455, partial [Hymenobacter sp.]
VDKALENFIELSPHERMLDSDTVYRYYAETLEYGYTTPLDIKAPQDIWNFVTPLDIIVHWDEDDGSYLCVSCDCEWEEEHGLQLVFKDGLVLTRASGHDGHIAD